MSNFLVTMLVEIWRRPAFIFLTFFSRTLIAVYGALFFWIEGPHNPKVTGIFDGIYFAVTTVTSVGFGDLTPLTVPGKALTILMMLTGTMIFVAFTALVSTAVIEAEMKMSLKSVNDGRP